MPVGVEQWRAAVGAMANYAAPKPRSPIGPQWNKWLKARDPVAYKGCVVFLVTIVQLLKCCVRKMKKKENAVKKEILQLAFKGNFQTNKLFSLVLPRILPDHNEGKC